MRRLFWCPNCCAIGWGWRDSKQEWHPATPMPRTIPATFLEDCPHCQGTGRRNWFPVGSRSVLFGAHAFWLHPFFVAAAWTKLYGFPCDLRLWVAFFVHDLGYWGCPTMGGPEGEHHVLWGAVLMKRWFGCRWWSFCANHSRFWARKTGARLSRLCYADKLALVMTPSWLYIPMAAATGEIYEYLKTSDSTGMNLWKWHARLKSHLQIWVNTHVDGTEDRWVRADIHRIH